MAAIVNTEGKMNPKWRLTPFWFESKMASELSTSEGLCGLNPKWRLKLVQAKAIVV